MGWAPASFALLALALGLGFAWYERTRPSARLLSVVATLAALAILGRIAFAPVPNVKPTTDIVLIAGYALGGAPGFAVGAVSALGSNLFFAQGPWTPWQMAAWGLVGVLGAGLAWAGGRRLGRVPLAIACGFAGLLHGVIMDLYGFATFAGEHTTGQYLVISGTSLPFNIAHAAGNVAFFLAFGPGLVRAVERCRTRFEIDWRPAAPALLALFAVLAVAPAPARAADAAVTRAAAWLEGARNADGGWGAAPRTSSSQLYGAWAAIGLAAAGRRVEPSASFVAAARRARVTADVERSVLALHAAGAPLGALPTTLAGRQRRDGSFGGQVNVTSFAVLALRAAGRRGGIARAARWIEGEQNPDGGWSFDRRGGPSGVDDTAAALQALAAARHRTAVARGVRFLRAAQARGGGFPLAPGGAPNAQSTAFAVQALLAAGADGAEVARALAFLHGLQAADGSVRYARGAAQTPVWVTGQALAALARWPLPVGPAPPPAPAAGLDQLLAALDAVSRSREL
jgi:energy-coupling factor transport system substrate-specific component